MGFARYNVSMSISGPFSRRFLICTLLAVLLVMIVFSMAAHQPRTSHADSREYIWTLFNNRGDEAMRRDGKVIYFRAGANHLGWSWYAADEAAIDKALSHEMRELVDSWLDNDYLRNEEPRHLTSWELKRFVALTNYDPESTDLAPPQWWQANRFNVVIDRPHFDAYVRVLRLQTHIKFSPSWNQDPRRVDDVKQLWADPLVTGFGLVALPHMYVRIDAIRSGRLARLNAAFEALYFTLLVYFFGYGLPRIRRSVHVCAMRPWLRTAVVAIVAYVAMILPYELGYSVPWFSYQPKGGLLYRDLLSVLLFPAYIIWQVPILGWPFVLFAGPCELLDRGIYPVFGWFDLIFSRPFGGNSRSLLCLIGSVPFVVVLIFAGAIRRELVGGER